MSEHPNAAILRRGYEAFAAGDLATIAGILDEGIDWHMGGHSAISGHYHGHEAVFGLFARLAEGSGGTLRLDIEHILADEERGVVLLRETATHEDKGLDTSSVHVWRFRDGKPVEFRPYLDDQSAADAFWGVKGKRPWMEPL